MIVIFGENDCLAQAVAVGYLLPFLHQVSQDFVHRIFVEEPAIDRLGPDFAGHVT
ncbi:MAG: hypothetical protein WA532_00135 [Candidatus Korobacteraceae bacterium]